MMDPLTMCRAFHYIFDAVLPFLQSFYACAYVLKGHRSQRESEVEHYLALSLQAFVDKVAPLLSHASDKKIMITAHQALLSATRVPIHMMEALQSRSGLNKKGPQMSDTQKQYNEYYKVENDINVYFENFAQSYNELYEGENTIKAQLGVNSEKEYTQVGGDEELPLGTEFQGLVSRFSDTKKTNTRERYALAVNLVRQLGHRGRPLMQTEADKHAQEDLDIQCLQVLRALLHNLIIHIDPKAPSPISGDTKKKLKTIHELQEYLVELNTIQTLVPHLDGGSDAVIRETLGVLAVMLYGGNRIVQEALYNYFRGTREGKFVFSCANRLQISAIGFKERHELESQHEELVNENIRQVKHLKQLVHTGSFGKMDMDESRLEHDLLDMVKEWVEDLPLWDEGSVRVLLKVISLMCEGQYTNIQDYLRYQPDNYRSQNLIAELTAFLLILLTYDRMRSPDILIGLLTTIRDTISGNPENQLIVVDCKICDRLQTLLEETPRLEPTIDVLKIQEAIGNLVQELLEDRSKDGKKRMRKPLKKEKQEICMLVAEALPHEALIIILKQAYTLEKGGSNDKEFVQLARKVGFKYYHLLRTIEDITTKSTCEIDAYCRDTVMPYYAKTTMSIEVVWNNKLSKIYFPIFYKDALRHEVKEMFNYGVERSGSDRIHEYLSWGHAITEDIRHTQKLQAVHVTRFLTKADFWLNMAMMLMSALIVIFMMITWQANPYNHHTVQPVYRYPWAQGLMLCLAITHYLITLCVVIVFFIINQPKLPTFISNGVAKFRAWRKKEMYVKPEDHNTHFIRTRLVSFATFWHVLLFVFSLAGCFYQYFCCFHLLHLARHVHLLQRVLEAITKNGKSLLLIYMFGLVLFYIFTLINFAFYRELFDSEAGILCHTFYECMITIHHRALVWNMHEGVPPPGLDGPIPISDQKTFNWMVGKAVTDLVFFIIISAIGLSMIFGVIVDTFAELRDKKWKTEQEMMGSCFICGRKSHEFENKFGGFQHHVKFEHNQWAYIFFWLYLKDNPRTTHSALEAYIYRQLEMEETDFLPQDRALCLETSTDTSSSQVYVLEARMSTLVDRVRELEDQHIKDLETIKQSEWLLNQQALANQNNYDIISPTLSIEMSERKVTFTEKTSGSDPE